MLDEEDLWSDPAGLCGWKFFFLIIVAVHVSPQQGAKVHIVRPPQNEREMGREIFLWTL